MFSFFKNKNDGSDQPAPSWSSFDKIDDYNYFIKLVKSYFKELDLEIEIRDGVVHATNNDFGLNNLGLQNVAQFCASEEKTNFKKHIYTHFNLLRESHEFSKKFEKEKKDYYKVKDYIGMRLYNEGYIANVGLANSVGKTIAGDIYAILVYDLPQSIISVTPKDAAIWGIELGQLFEIAEKNSRRNYPLEITKKNVNGIDILTVETDHFFSPNIILDLKNRPDLTGTHGSLIAVPTRNVAIIYPIENLSVAQAINALIPVVYNVFQKGPGSLSNNLIWYYQSALENQPYKIEDGKLSFRPSERFVEMLNKMK